MGATDHTSGKRQAAWRARQASQMAEALRTVEALRTEVGQLRAELERQALRTGREQALRTENAALKAKLAALKAAAAAPPDPDTEAARLQTALERSRKEAAGYKKQLRRIQQAPLGQLTIGRAIHRKIVRCLHPDTHTDPAMRRRLTEAFQIFTDLPMTVVEEVD
jgi:hypothetical protein